MKVLLSGYYGFGNLGDEAILAGLAPALAARGIDLTVLSASPSATARLHAVKAVDRLAGAPLALLGQPAFVSGGGGLLQDSTSGRSLAYYLTLLRAAKALRRRTAVYAQSLGPLSPTGRRRVAGALRGVPLAVRDHQSLVLAAELGLQAELVGDPALLMPRPERHPLVDADGPVLLIPRGGHQRFNEPLARLAAGLTSRSRRVTTLALQPVVDAPPADAIDAAAAQGTVTEGAGSTRIAADTPQAALAAIAQARLVVSVRLHGCILAAVAGAPFVALSYDPKVAGFAALAGAEVVAPEAPLAELLAACERARALSDAARGDLVGSAERGVAWLVDALRA